MFPIEPFSLEPFPELASEEHGESLEASLEALLEELPEKLKPLCASRLSALKKALLEKLSEMRGRGAPAKELEAFSRQASIELQREKERFLEQRERCSKERQEGEGELNEFQKLLELTFEAVERDWKMERMVEAALFDAANEAVSYLPEKLLEGAGEALKAGCNSHPEVKKVCKKTRDLTREAFRSLGEALFPEELLKEREEAIGEESAHNEKLGIPREATEQFYRDLEGAAGLALFFLPIKGAGKLLRSPSLKTAEKLLQSSFEKQSFEGPASIALSGCARDLAQELPVFSGLNPEKAWLASMGKEGAPLLTDQILKEGRGKSIRKISLEKVSYIVKQSSDLEEILGEMVGFKAFHRLGLKEIHFPRLQSLGALEGEYFLVKTYMQGISLDRLFEQTAKSSLHKKGELFSACLEASSQTGRAFGELCTKTGSKEAPKKGYFTSSLIDLAEEVEALSPKGFRWSEARLEKIERAFIRSPGKLVYGFSDISLGQFVWSKAERLLAFVDGEFLSASFNLAGKPLLSAAEEYYKFLIDLECESLRLGFSREELLRLKTAFQRGYREKSSEEFTEEAVSYFLEKTRLERARLFAEQAAD